MRRCSLTRIRLEPSEIGHDHGDRDKERERERGERVSMREGEGEAFFIQSDLELELAFSAIFQNFASVTENVCLISTKFQISCSTFQPQRGS